MKPLTILLSFGTAGLLIFGGCGKKDVPSQAPYDISGVKVDIPKLQATFVNSPDLQPILNQAVSQLRYGQYLSTMQQLDQLANNPALNEAQKKALADVIEQMKQVINKVGPTRQ
jgi:hypothetical protein